MSKRVACMCERLCRDPRTCAPSDSVYAFVSIAFDEGERGDWSKESERGRERSGKGEMKAERDEYNNRRSFH